ncbi:MAG: CDP-glucose 4,6-dehydratase [Glaciecola sp.]|jgi:CDP-glucose 4,6-dehydratase
MSFWQGKKVFVTGLSGLIAQHLISNLSDLGAEVAVFSRQKTDIPALVNPDNVFTGDISNKDDISAALIRFPAELVVHLAAQSQTSNQNISSTFQTNTLGTLHLFEAVKTLRPNTSVILASSVAVHTRNNEYAATTYAASKQCAEIIAQNYSATNGINCMALRLSNIYGPGDQHKGRLIPSLINAMLKQEEIQLRSHIDTKTNLLYVQDAVDGILLVGRYLMTQKRSYQALSLCNKESVTTRDLITRLSQCLNSAASVKLNEDEQASAAYLVLPSEFLELTLGWHPQVNIEDGLEKTVNWYQHRLNEEGNHNESVS